MLNTIKKELLREEFYEIAREIVTSSIFLDLKNEVHHGTTRYDHSMRVAWAAFICAKKLGWNPGSVTIAALCHDLFRKEDCEKLTKKDINKMHPMIAANLAKKHFDISEIEEKAILSHMWPLAGTRASSKEGRLLGYVDKCIAIAEGIGYNPVAKTIKRAARAFTQPVNIPESEGYSLSLNRR